MTKQNSKDLILTGDNKSNKTNQLVASEEGNEMIDALLSEKGVIKSKKKAKFFFYYFWNLPVKVCANLSDVKLNTAYKWTSKYKKDLNFRTQTDKIFESFLPRFKTFTKASLPRVAHIMDSALKEYEDNPKLAIEKPQILKLVGQAAGAIGDDYSKAPAVVNIKEVRAMMIQAQHQPASNHLDTGTVQAQDDGEPQE